MVYHRMFREISKLVDFANGLVGADILAVKFDEVRSTWNLIYKV